MKLSLITLLVLSFAAVAYGQNPVVAREANPNLQIVDARWIARGGTLVYPEKEPAPLHMTPSRDQVASTAAVLVTNTSGKTIKNFDLEYIFQDVRNAEFLRYRFHAKANLKPGHTRKFVQDIYEKAGRYRYRYSPIKSRFDTLLATNDASTKVIVRRIEYADGSVWERP
ncbi:MAG TPA: FxLYD domain-containing protein [Pyrinomonadaceae bacterium]|nr:FxLYD domain-containing protein [Pyrinomonadaceae bacterium]